MWLEGGQSGVLDVEIHKATTTQGIVWTMEEAGKIMRSRHMLSQIEFAIEAQNTEMQKLKRDSYLVML